ncbi:MAG: nicotinate-nucleotide--dimethylbenzimidazole phosphoribosyltransferase [Clostridia bacterium]|nr:nicotinate-nucleotide--dimethylbenzimidazole phosphoribosyltransferase [Clostridia bacterium]
MSIGISDIISGIGSLDRAAMALAEDRQARLAKPPHSLGRLEDISVKLAGITGKLYCDLDRRRVLIFASDNGIVREGVSSAPQSVTLSQTVNFTRGLTGVAVLARHFHAELDVIDVGIDAGSVCPGVRDQKIARGTRDFAREPAMSRHEALRAMMVGRETALRAASDGMDVIGVGEMGIGNTTTSSAVLSALLGLPAAGTVNRGAGINDDAYARKMRLIDEAIGRWKPDPDDPVDVISKVGGFDIAAMCGAFLGAASARLPVVIDGFISAVAALCAWRLEPLSADYMFPSHASREQGYRRAMDAMGMRPMLELDMRLGEGSGCPIAFEIMAAAERVIREMGTFEEAAIDDSYLDEIRAEKRYTGEA